MEMPDKKLAASTRTEPGKKQPRVYKGRRLLQEVRSYDYTKHH